MWRKAILKKQRAKKDKNTEKIQEGTIGDATNEVKILSETGAIYID
ncbi:hypothetical protein [Bacillus hominis]|nr:hypothetical protein [Bacillus hominis]